MPAKTTPAPPPIPNSDETRPIAPGTRSLGNSSRMIEKASGKMPPPAPWMTRPKIISGRDEAIADISVPNASISSTSISRRSFPYMSPSRPMIKLGRITMHRYTEALEPFGIRPRHVAALIELRDRGELTQQSLCGQLHLDPTNLVAILNELEQRGLATRRRDPKDRRRHLVEVSKKGIAVLEKVSEVMDGVEAVAFVSEV